MKRGGNANPRLLTVPDVGKYLPTPGSLYPRACSASPAASASSALNSMRSSQRSRATAAAAMIRIRIGAALRRGTARKGVTLGDSTPLVGRRDHEARDGLVLRDPCCRHGASLERNTDVHLDGTVPDEQAFVDDVEVPLVQAAVARALALIPLVPEEHDAARAHDAGHVGDDRERVGTVIERVDGVGDVEASRAEVLEQTLPRDADRANRRIELGVTEQPVILVGERIGRDDRQALPRVAVAETRHRARTDVENGDLLGLVLFELCTYERIPDLGVWSQARVAVPRPFLVTCRTGQPSRPEVDLAAGPRSPPQAAAETGVHDRAARKRSPALACVHGHIPDYST